ncbi:MAG: hypothetical protein ACE5I1_10595 [bacterium]
MRITFSLTPCFSAVGLVQQCHIPNRFNGFQNLPAWNKRTSFLLLLTGRRLCRVRKAVETAGLEKKISLKK